MNMKRMGGESMATLVGGVVGVISAIVLARYLKRKMK